MVMIGILPTLAPGHIAPQTMSANPRYQLLSEQILARPRRGHPDRHHRAGAAAARPRTRSCPRRPAPAPSSTCRPRRTSSRRTGTPPRRSAASSSPSAPTRRTAWARSCGARPGSRSSSRPPTPAARSSRRRACGRGCGSASAGSTRSSTCSRRTSATSRRCCRSPTTRTRSRCSRRAGPRSSRELRLHNGTIYRWNRPVYDVVDGTPHLRVENRVLPAGPTVVDTIANAAFYFGLVRAPRRERPAAVVADVVPGRRGELPRRGRGRHRRQRLLARARRGAGDRARPAPAAADGARGPGVVGSRRPRRRPAARHHRAALPAPASTARAGSSTGCTAAAGDDRYDALRATLQEYRERMHTNEPVHTWD